MPQIQGLGLGCRVESGFRRFRLECSVKVEGFGAGCP